VTVYIPAQEATPPTRFYQILSRWTGAVKFEFDCASLRLCVEAANLSGADISCANLSCADLSDADLSGADLNGAGLSGANLSDANLRGANLRGANLSCANLRGADLRGANLSCADLNDANLRGAGLSGADLSDADLSDANLNDADLSGANLRPIRADLYDVLVTARAEARGFLLALQEGRVNGSCYKGECACLVGTIANLRGVDADLMDRDPSRPIERFLFGVKKGDTPETNPVAKLVAEWTKAFVGEPSQ
jgi:uncharacterized protein YjbI with pentapeptide repeats